jgi:hypothetical protein
MCRDDLTEPVTIRKSDFLAMRALVRVLHRLQNNSSYLQLLRDRLPETVLHDPGIDSILMGYDFHIGPNGPQLIEINNNAGGLFTGRGWLVQPDIPDLQGSLEERLTGMFSESWRCIAIMDERIEEQYMYPEMLAFARLLEEDGRRVVLLEPSGLRAGPEGDLYANDMKIDAIYNRHTDFYLLSEEMAHIRAAYLSDRIRLTPNPRSYGLLGDKRRMVDWWHEGLLESLSLAGEDIRLIRRMVPEIHLLSEMDPESVWKDRRQWVFKPVARHGGKGVLLGRSMSRKRFEAMDPGQTVMQRYIPPAEVERAEGRFKMDIRLYTHGEHLIALAGRVYQGMLTNFRSPGSGFVPLAIIP